MPENKATQVSDQIGFKRGKAGDQDQFNKHG